MLLLAVQIFFYLYLKLSKVFLHFMFTDQKTNNAQEKHNNKFTSVAEIQSMIGQLGAGRRGASIKHLWATQWCIIQYTKKLQSLANKIVKL